MYLRDLEIENFRSLEKVKLGNLGKLNVLIGRNNSGKSSVFGTLQTLRTAIGAGGNVDWTTILTEKDLSRRFNIRLEFELTKLEREAAIKFCGTAQAESRRITLRDSPFFRRIRF